MLADISSLAQNKRLVVERNEAEIFTFDLDLYVFEAFCTSINADPHTLLAPYQTDVKLKRNGAYMYGFQVVDITFDLAADTGSQQTTLDQKVTVTCTGYLNLFTDRYVTYTYTTQDASYIAGDLLTQAQAATNGSVGVTVLGGYSTGVNRDRTYVRQNVKTGIQDLTKLVDGRFDFAFTYDKKFVTYSQIGSRRADVRFQFGGDGSNIISLVLTRSGLGLYNEIIGLGSGFGADQLISTQDDATSQGNYYLRQGIKQYNSVIEQSTLDQNATADLSLSKDILEIPQITITGKELTTVPFLSIGDRIPITIVSHPFLSNLSGLYFRIEKMDIKIDENDFENAIDLYFDNWSVTGT